MWMVPARRPLPAADGARVAWRRAFIPDPTSAQVGGIRRSLTEAKKPMNSFVLAFAVSFVTAASWKMFTGAFER